MTTDEYLLIRLMEECAEVSQRASKALSYGLDEIQPGQEHNNAERLAQELDDLEGIKQLLRCRNVLRRYTDHVAVGEKIRKVDRFTDYSKSLGIIKDV